MSVLDIFFVIVLVFFLLRGLYRGLFLEVASIVGLVAGFLAANRFYMDVYPLVQQIINSQDWAQIVSYAGIFLLVLVAVLVLASFLRSLLRMVMLGWLDTLGGGFLGLLKAGLICSLALLLLTVFLPKDHELIASSKIAPYVFELTKNLAAYLPEDLKEAFADKTQAMTEFWQNSMGKH